MCGGSAASPTSSAKSTRASTSARRSRSGSATRREPARQRAVDLAGGEPVRELALGVDHVGDGLGLREIHASVEERALGELARARGTCAGGEQCDEQRATTTTRRRDT